MRKLVTDGRRTAAFRHAAVILIAGCFVELHLAGCRATSNAAADVSVQQQIGPQPIHAGQATITIQLADASARPVIHAKINVEGNMSHPGMAPIFERAAETSPGSYVAHLDLKMSGDWVLLSHIVLADGRKLEKQMDVKGVESNR